MFRGIDIFIKPECVGKSCRQLFSGAHISLWLLRRITLRQRSVPDHHVLIGLQPFVSLNPAFVHWSKPTSLNPQGLAQFRVRATGIA